MSQNRLDNENDFGGTINTGGGSAGTSTPAGGGGYSAGTGGSAGTGLTTTGGASGTAAGGPESGIAAKAREYGQMVADAASQVRDKASVVGEKLQDLRNIDYADQAKDYARQNPGQAILIAAAVGFVVGFLMRPPGDPTTPPPPPRKRR